MGRNERLRRRAKICGWLLRYHTSLSMLMFGYAPVVFDWRRALPRGLLLPYWRGLPMVSIKKSAPPESAPA